jgi:hypothetical protein
MNRVSVDFHRALTNVEDGLIAQERNEIENMSHFAKEAKAALDAVPEEIPYIEDYYSALDERDFEQAFDTLANFAAYVRENDNEEIEFAYPESTLERVEEAKAVRDS